MLALALLGLLLVPAAALARAGGGQSSNPGFSGGGSSGGGSSGGSIGGFAGGALAGSAVSGGGGSFSSVVVIIILIVAFLIVRGYLRKSGVLSGPQTGTPTPAPGPTTFDQLKADDPNFSEQAFYGRVNEMFLTIQEAWEARNLEPARRFLSEAQFQVLAQGVDEYVKNGQINKLDSLHVDRMEPVSVTREGDSDYVRVLITASVIDYTVDERTGEIVNPSVLGDGKTVKTFQEYWTLVRKVGAQSKSDATIKKCPNCGAPVTDGNYVKCAYCGTMMNDPALDWVLLRIEQP